MPTVQDESTYFLQLLKSASDLLPKPIPPIVAELIAKEFKVVGFEIGINGLKRWLLEDNGQTFPNFKRLMELGGGHVKTAPSLDDAAICLASSCLSYLKANYYQPDIVEYASKTLDIAQIRTLDLAGGLCYLAKRVTTSRFLDELELDPNELKFVMNELKRCAVVVLKQSPESIEKYTGVLHGTDQNQAKGISGSV